VGGGGSGWASGSDGWVVIGGVGVHGCLSQSGRGSGVGGHEHLGIQLIYNGLDPVIAS
jgi:hypothetical protein